METLSLLDHTFVRVCTSPVTFELLAQYSIKLMEYSSFSPEISVKSRPDRVELSYPSSSSQTDSGQSPPHPCAFLIIGGNTPGVISTHLRTIRRVLLYLVSNITPYSNEVKIVPGGGRFEVTLFQLCESLKEDSGSLSLHTSPIARNAQLMVLNAIQNTITSILRQLYASMSPTSSTVRWLSIWHALLHSTHPTDGIICRFGVRFNNIREYEVICADVMDTGIYYGTSYTRTWIHAMDTVRQVIRIDQFIPSQR